MKKTIAVFLVAVMAISLSACGKTNSVATDEKMKVAENYKVTYNLNEGNTENLPNYQFLGADFSKLLNYDSRLYIDLTLNLDGESRYELIAESYVIERGERQEPGGETGIGQTWIATGTGTYTDNGDGTILTNNANKVTLKVKTDVYSSQLKESIGFSVNGSSEDGEWNSDDTPELLTFMPGSLFTVADGKILSYVDPDAKEEAETIAEMGDTVEEAETETAETENVETLIVIPSNDSATSFSLLADGTYIFYFESFDISDCGTYAYEDGVLTVTDKNGSVTVSEADGENIKLHYVYSDSDQLTGDYTVDRADIDAAIQ